ATGHWPLATGHWSLRFRFHQRELAVRPAEQHVDGVGGGIAEHDHAFADDLDFLDRVADRHRFDRLPRGADDPRHARALAAEPADGPHGDRLAVFGGDGAALRGPLSLASLPLAFYALRLLTDPGDRLAERGLPRRRIAD